MKGKVFLTLIAAGMLMTGFAEAADINIEKNFSTNTITVSGKGAESEHITIQILPENLSIKDFAAMTNPEDYAIFAKDYQADATGEYQFTAEISNSGSYTVYISGNKSDRTQQSVKFVNSGDYLIGINALNGATDKDDFINLFKANADKLGFDDTINTTVGIENVAGMMYDELNGKTLSASEFTENNALYKQCAAILALNGAKITNVSDYVDDIVKNDATFGAFWNKHVNTEEKEEFFTSKLANKNIENVAALKTEMKKALILTAVKYPDGYINIKSIFETYNSGILDLSSISSKDGVYSSLAGKNYNTVSELVSAYNSLVKDLNSGSSSGGGGGGNWNSSPISSVEMDKKTDYTQNNELSLKFNDLDSVRWAYSSISVLYEKGIIDGVSETEFQPEAEVKREQFTKMLVSALESELTGESAGFADIADDAWYAPYVNTAYKNGIVNGISGNEFGVSRNITRQDMAVMIYNAMLKNGYENSGAEISFADNGEIAEYAKTAVAELAKAGIINGKGDNLFVPTATATRAEAAVIIERALTYLR